MKLSFWDILASMVMLGGLALATIFINIFINPYSFINPFPPPTPVASLQVPTLTPSQRSLPELWTATPETPGVPSVTKVNETVTITVTGTRLVLPTGTATSTRTKTPTPSKSITNTPNRTLTSIAYKTPTKTTSSSTDDTTPPTAPGFPYCYCDTSDSTPTFTWAASTDSGGSGLKGYKVTFGTDSGGNNTIYTTTTNSWTAPTISTVALYYMWVRAVDNAGNESAWVGPNGFNYGGAGAPSVTTNAATAIGNSTATLNGLVNANLSSTTVVFQYGLTAAYGTNVTLPTALNGNVSTNVSTTITGLTPGTLYHFRAAAYNGVGGTYGGDLTFTTSSLPATTTTITGDAPDPSDRGAAYSVSATVAGAAPTGTVAVNDGSGATCTISLAGGSGSCNLTSTTAGAKTITAVYSGDGSNAPSSDTESHVVNKSAQAALVAVVTPGTVVFGSTAALSTTGGSGSGAVTFSAGGSTGCSVAGTTLSVTNATGSCDITATKAEDANYLSATSVPVAVILQKANQAALTAISTPGTITYGSTGTLSYSGGSGTGAVTYSEGASTGCSVAGTTLSITNASGTCTVTATKAADNNYNVISSAALTVNMNKAAAAVTWPSAGAITYGAALSTSTLSGGSATPTGTFAWTAPATVPDVPGGSFEMTFTPDDAVNYNTETNNISITVNQATTTVTSWPTATVVTGQPLSTAVLSGGAASVSGTFSFDDPSFVPPSGSNSYSATFTPDSGNYTIVSGSITVTASP